MPDWQRSALEGGTSIHHGKVGPGPRRQQPPADWHWPLGWRPGPCQTGARRPSGRPYSVQNGTGVPVQSGRQHPMATRLFERSGVGRPHYFTSVLEAFGGPAGSRILGHGAFCPGKRGRAKSGWAKPDLQEVPGFIGFKAGKANMAGFFAKIAYVGHYARKGYKPLFITFFLKTCLICLICLEPL